MLTIERPLLEHMPDDIVERLIYELNGRDHDSNTAAVTAYLALCKAVEDGAEVKGIYDGSSIKLTTSGVQPDFVAILQQRFTAMLQLTNNMPPNFTIRFTRDPLKTNNGIFFINPMDDIVYMQPTFFNFHEVRQLIMLYRAIIKSPQNMDNSDMIHFAFGLQRYMAPFWDQTWSKAPLNKGPKDFAVELVRKGEIRAGHKVLCLGEGFGFDAMFFARQQCHVTATDFSSVAIEHINKLAKEKNIESSLHGEVLDMRQLFSYADASFDIVCAFQSLMYFDDNAFRQIIKEIYRVLKPGGRVFISVRSKDDYKYKDNPLRIGNISLDRQGRVRRFYDREELISFFNEEGFKNIEAYEKPLKGYKNEPVSSTIRLSAEKTSYDSLGKKIIKPILLGTAI